MNTLNCILLISISTLFVSCESHEAQSETAFERVKATKETDDTSNALPAISATSTTVAVVTKLPKTIVEQSVYDKFKTALVKTIAKNKATIATLSALPSLTSKQSKKLKRAEKSNEQLKLSMIEFDEETKLRFDKFKTLMNDESLSISSDLDEFNTK